MFDFTKNLLRTELMNLDFYMLHTRTNEAYREYDARRTELLDVISMLRVVEEEAKEKKEKKETPILLARKKDVSSFKMEGGKTEEKEL